MYTNNCEYPVWLTPPSPFLHSPSVRSRSGRFLLCVSFFAIEGTILSEMVECPTDIIAQWNYEVTDSKGNSYCSVNSSLDICQNTTLIFNTTQCSGNILHSGNLVYPRYRCLYTIYNKLFKQYDICHIMTESLTKC